jgi:hypothetical protein
MIRGGLREFRGEKCLFYHRGPLGGAVLTHNCGGAVHAAGIPAGSHGWLFWTQARRSPAFVTLYTWSSFVPLRPFVA